jgi:hypothetical protein
MLWTRLGTSGLISILTPVFLLVYGEPNILQASSIANRFVGGADPASTTVGPQMIYPSTFTSIYSSTGTSVQLNPLAPMTRIEIITTATFTLLEPRGATSFPASVIQTVTSVVEFTYLATPGAGPIITSTGTDRFVNPTTWVLYQPEATDLPAGTTLEDLPCNECSTAAIQEDRQCAALSLETACQGQCDMRDGIWWCRHMRVLEDGTPAQMGRACWGGDEQYGQLMTPCVSGDYRIGCTPCEGRASGWLPTNWLW